MLEEIRFLLNLRMDSYSAMSLMLVGQTELKETLKLQINNAIWQRVDMRFHLPPLSKEETTAYIAKHLIFPVSFTDHRGKIRKKYPYNEVMTPYEKFKSLPLGAWVTTIFPGNEPSCSLV